MGTIAQLAKPEAKHEALPDVETFRKARSGEPVGKEPAPWEFPLLADCLTCRKAVQRQDSLFSDWKHL